MSRFIVSGACGFVGSRFVKYALEQGDEIVALDLAAECLPQLKDDRLTYISADIGDTEKWQNAVPAAQYNAFVHFAWVGSAGAGRTDCELQTRNALTAVACVRAAQQLGCRRFVCAGSIMEREVAAAIAAQGSKPGMGYVYGVGKLLAHCLCKPVAAECGIELVWPLITNAYGEGERSPRFINTTIRKIIAGEPLQFTAATQNYDFIHVDDTAQAFYLITTRGRPFCEYVIGSGKARPLREFILELQRELAPQATPVFGDVPFTGTELPLSAFDTSDTSRDTGFCPQVSFAQGVRRTMEWIRNDDIARAKGENK